MSIPVAAEMLTISGAAIASVARDGTAAYDDGHAHEAANRRDEIPVSANPGEHVGNGLQTANRVQRGGEHGGRNNEPATVAHEVSHGNEELVAACEDLEDLPLVNEVDDHGDDQREENGADDADDDASDADLAEHDHEDQRQNGKQRIVGRAIGAFPP